MNLIKKNWLKIIFILILLAGVVVGIYLVNHPQILKSKASSDINDSIGVSSDGVVTYEGNNTFKTNSKNIRINLKNLDQLITP